jgi:DNA-binding NarL/FixJ family response regulator
MELPWPGEARRDSTNRQRRRSIRVVVVVREVLNLQAMVSLLSRVPEFEVVGLLEANSEIDQLIAAVGRGVLLVDVEDDRPRPDDLISRALAASPGMAIMALIPRADVGVASRWVSAGVRACVPRDSSGIELQNAIRWIAEGARWVSPRLLPQSIVETHRKAQQPKADEQLALLTVRELDVLLLMVAGLDTNELARQLSLSVRTVRTHISKILMKLGVDSAEAAVSVAHSAGLQPTSPQLKHRGPPTT